MQEQWKVITEATNYEVSNLGRVRNSKTGFILNPDKSGTGYSQVSIKIKDTNKFQRRYVHRLVATYWIENDSPQYKTEVNHKNMDKHDNSVNNLEWVTPSENQKHKYANRKIKTSNRRVTQLDLEGNVIATFDSVLEAAKSVNGSRQGIDLICKGDPKRKTAHGFKWKYLD